MVTSMLLFKRFRASVLLSLMSYRVHDHGHAEGPCGHTVHAGFVGSLCALVTWQAFTITLFMLRQGARVGTMCTRDRWFQKPSHCGRSNPLDDNFACVRITWAGVPARRNLYCVAVRNSRRSRYDLVFPQSRAHRHYISVFVRVYICTYIYIYTAAYVEVCSAAAKCTL